VVAAEEGRLTDAGWRDALGGDGYKPQIQLILLLADQPRILVEPTWRVNIIELNPK